MFVNEVLSKHSCSFLWRKMCCSLDFFLISPSSLPSAILSRYCPLFAVSQKETHNRNISSLRSVQPKVILLGQMGLSPKNTENIFHCRSQPVLERQSFQMLLFELLIIVSHSAVHIVHQEFLFIRPGYLFSVALDPIVVS